jgi:formylglycine-generating enzyme required for sulfatase activity
MNITYPHAKGDFFTVGLAACLPLALASVPGEHMSFDTRITPEMQLAAAVPTVRVAASSFRYRSAGSFLRAQQPVNAPLQWLEQKTPLTIMQAQVSEAAYEVCVQAGACRPTTRRTPARVDLPVTGVSFDDASSYARWLSARTGET